MFCMYVFVSDVLMVQNISSALHTAMHIIHNVKKNFGHVVMLYQCSVDMKFETLRFDMAWRLDIFNYDNSIFNISASIFSI